MKLVHWPLMGDMIHLVPGPPRASAGPGADHIPGPSRLYIPSPSPALSSLPSFSFPALPSHPAPLPYPPSLPSLPVEVGPLNPGRGSGGALKAPPAGSGAEPQPKLNLVHFSLKIWHLVATISMIILRINLIYLPTQFHAVDILHNVQCTFRLQIIWLIKFK